MPNLVSVSSFTTTDDPFLSFMQRKHSKKGRKKSGVMIEVYRMENGQDFEDIIFNQLQLLDVRGSGNFCQRKTKSNTEHVQYKCERGRKTRSISKNADPNRTRANDCGAYISFTTDEQAGQKACVVRYSLTHCGHDPLNLDERRVSKLDADLLCYINELIDQGKRGMAILNCVHKWSKTNGHQDFGDRRFYPTPADVKYCIEARRARTRYDCNDAQSVEHLCRTDLQDKILIDQPLNSYLEGLKKAGRIKNKSASRESQGRRKAEQMISQGWANIVLWQTNHVCYVPSETLPATAGYLVDIMHATCECQAASQGGMCKHLHTALTLAATKGIDVVEERRQHATVLCETSSYTIDDVFLTVLDGDTVGIVNMKMMTCICVASSHDIDCICKYTAELVVLKHSITFPCPTECPVQSFDSPDKVSEQPSDCFKRLISDISQWSEQNHNVTPQILTQTKRLHTRIFGQFNHIHRHRKNIPLHPYKKIDRKSKKNTV
ncbi:PREDICTED: uncharacterized protein LOC106815634 isoform X2 [Priapulus caudatus]|uniref:Uncharacterized protein LOC106815634 isoform X2 n=1 Tax=Priapulus caudatus TaxID=37621 RepID=A0ABM1ETT7_PRICU|nr:PREDICTED: uncharacterized protein LOC106815634 isoform X2 [Priapulus caudatus]